MRRIFRLVIIVCLFLTEVFCFLVEQKDGGFVWENIFGFATQVDEIGLGNVNGVLLKNSGCININPATLWDIYYKEITLLYSPLNYGSDLAVINYSMPLDIGKFKFPFGIQIVRVVSGEAERFNSLGESYGYKFRENFIANTLAISYYVAKEDINLGLGIKNVYQTIDDYSGCGMNFDLGLIGPTKDKYVCGLSWLNVIPVKFGSEETISVLKSGLNYEIFSSVLATIKLCCDIELVNIYNFEYSSLRWGVGSKITFFKLPISISCSYGYYGLMGGINFFKDNINFGYGIKYDLIGLNHKFGIVYKFDFYPEDYIVRVQEEKLSLEEEKQKFVSFFNEQKSVAQKVKQESQLQQKVLLKLISAKELYEKREYEKSKVVLEEVLKMDPSNDSAKELLRAVNVYLDKNVINNLLIEAKTLYEKGKYEDAIGKLEKILSLQEDNVKARVLVKLCSAQKNILSKKYKEAKSDLFEILRLDLSNEEATELLKKVDTLLELEKQE